MKLQKNHHLYMLFNRLQMNPKQFSESLGFRIPDMIYNVLRGRNKVSSRLANIITKKYPDINYVWVLTGMGKMLKSNKETIDELKKLVQDRNASGNVVYADPDGLNTMPLAEFISQPADGILYDLNRTETVTYALAKEDDPRWINDIAVAQVIRALKNEMEKLKTAEEMAEKEMMEHAIDTYHKMCAFYKDGDCLKVTEFREAKKCDRDCCYMKIFIKKIDRQFKNE